MDEPSRRGCTLCVAGWRQHPQHASDARFGSALVSAATKIFWQRSLQKENLSSSRSVWKAEASSTLIPHPGSFAIR